jgi:hypothetical protein
MEEVAGGVANVGATLVVALIVSEISHAMGGHKGPPRRETIAVQKT